MGDETKVVTESDLQKSLERLEGKKPGKTDAPPTVTAGVAERKTVEQTVTEKGSEQLRKAIDASSVLAEFTQLVGLHIDEALDVLQKSVQQAAVRDLSVIGLFEGLKKSMEDGFTAVGSKLTELAAQPARPVGKAALTARPSQIAARPGEGAEGEHEDAPEVTRQQIGQALFELAKSADGSEKGGLMQAVATFESTGKCSDQVLRKALDHIAKGRKAA